jgi:hypothetical protein
MSECCSPTEREIQTNRWSYKPLAPTKPGKTVFIERVVRTFSDLPLVCD